MSDVVIKVQDVGKLYKLGEIGTGTISHDLNRWFARVRGKEDPFAKIGQTNDRTTKANSDYVWALKDINFEVKQGEVLGIIGRNGAGKSTLLKILSKVTTPSKGKIKVKGRIASLLEVGTGFHPELTGRENIFLNGAILGMTKSEIKSKFDEIVDFAGVERYIDTPVKRYSSGMYVRLAFAVAAFLEPEILIVDEVLAVGDAEFQKKCLGRMKDVSENDGRTVLFVSHNMAAVENLCNRGIFMENGILNSEGTMTKIISNYLNNKQNELGIPLSSRGDSKGDGFIKFEKILIGNKNFDQVYNIVKSGQTIVIRVFFKVVKKEINRVKIDIGINNEKEIRVTWLSSSINFMENLSLTKEKEYADFVISDLQLVPGSYSLTLFASHGGEVADWISNAFSFDVEQGDFYSNGRFPPSDQGLFLTKQGFNY